MKTKTLIKKLNERFPNINAVDYSEWDGMEEGAGIWLRNAEEHIHFNQWGSLESMEGEVYDYLTSVGWFLEPNDNVTMMAWKG